MKSNNTASRGDLLRALAAGLATGAATGLLAAVLSAPLRRWAGVGDRALINGASAVGLAIGFWLLGGLLYWAIAPRTRRPALWLAGAVAALGLLAVIVIYAGAGPSPLTPYPTRFASLAVPLIALVALGGALLYRLLLPLRLPALESAAGGAFIVALVVGGVVYGVDRQGKVHYTLTTAGASSVPARAANPALGTAATAAAPSATAQATAAATAPQPVSAVATAAPAAAASDGALQFVVAQGSEVSYTVNEKLARLPGPSDAIGKTQTISGAIWLTPQGLDTSHPSTITVDLRTLQSDAPQRDRFLLNSSLESKTYPFAVYTISAIKGFPTSVTPGQPTQQMPITLEGTLAVHKQQQPEEWTGTAVYNGSQIEVVMSTQFDMADFGITPPNISVAQAKSGVKLDAHIYATQQG
jgi:polyisoprenoid-binding protein YceI